MQYPFEPHKIDGYFTDQREGYLHAGVDFNGIGGGNTDLETTLYPIANGTVIFTSTSTKGYGLMCILETRIDNHTYYIGYCHLQEVLQKSGPIRMDQPLAKMGSTGNSKLSHLHLFCFKQRPPKDNWRWVTNNLTDLHTYMVDPLWLIKTYKGFNGELPEGAEMALATKYGCSSIDDLDLKIYEHVGTSWGNPDQANSGHLGAERRKTRELQAQIIDQTTLKDERDALRHSMEYFANILGNDTQANEASISAKINELIRVEDENRNLNKALEDQRVKYEAKIGDLEAQLDQLANQLANVRRELQTLKENPIKEVDKQMESNQVVMSFIHTLFTLVKEKLWRKQ